ncbi:MAG TPA: hypothetical protein VHQ90_00575 [Thermoanaerobaculia bacterium]|nr:hypothetical protein [Thermoanaerobaculia bacterium]
MKLGAKIAVWTLSLVAAAILALVVVVIVAYSKVASTPSPGVATSFVPDCLRDDAVCAVWTEFRQARPYPHQTFALRSLPDHALALIISEPPPTLSKSELEGLIKTAFGDDLVALQRLRWKIGIDGWVEDLVLKVKAAPTQGQATDQAGDPLDDPLLRDRIALLHLALFDTAYGGQLELVGTVPAQAARSAAPNLHVSAKEIRDWLAEPQTLWHPIEGGDAQGVSWTDVAARKMTGAFISDDASLIMLAFPTETLTAARADSRSLTPLRADFRRFAVASDAILGGIWNANGETAILARFRVQPPALVPPLRFETFALLAAQSSNELRQSYERTSLFAGKLPTGDYQQRDWAPIYLSEALIDTEFGALLNLTDQMLKSWSEAGAIEYLYFTYPLKPDRFPFKEGPLTTLVEKQSGSKSVLFNWNTSGSAAVTQLPELAVLNAKQTGALPVTYGSELRPGEDVTIGHLSNYEQQAYEYFAGLKDPNLARVVQYTLIYQLFRAIAGETAAPQAGITAPGSRQDTGGPRADSSALLVSETARFLNESRGDPPKPLLAFRSRHPEIDDPHLALLLANPRAERSTLRADESSFNRDIANHREEAQTAKADLQRWRASLPSEPSSTEEERNLLPEELRTRIDRLNSEAEVTRRRREELDSREKLLRDAGDLCRALNGSENLLDKVDLDAVRKKYLNQNTGEPEGSIKTPSAVVSWDTLGAVVGGHNLDAHALRLEPAADVPDLALIQTERGLVLRYNPSRADSIAAKATDLARAVEYGKVRSTEQLARILEEPIEARPRRAALEIPAETTSPGASARFDKWAGRLGNRVYTERAAFVEDLRGMAETNECCVLVARDQQQSTFITEPNPTPPPAVLRVIEIRDTPSLNAYIRKAANSGESRPMIFLDQPQDYVQALTLGLENRSSPPLSKLAQWLGLKGSRAAEQGLTITHFDLSGRPTSLRLTDGASGGSTLLGRLATILKRSQSWREAQVTELEPQTAEAYAQLAGWNTERDGVPAAVVVTFQPQGQRLDLGIVAGFEPGDLAAGQEKLRAVHQQSLADALAKDATVVQHFMTTKNELRSLSDLQIKRLMFVVKEGQTQTLISRLELGDELAAPGQG